MEHTETVLIQRPAADVWALVGNPATWGDWQPGVEGPKVEGGKPAVGKRLTFSFRGNPQDAAIAWYEPERLFGFTSAQPSYDFAEWFTLASDSDGTRVSMTMSFQPTKAMLRVISVFLVPIKGFVLGNSLKKELAALKDKLEGSQTA